MEIILCIVVTMMTFVTYVGENSKILFQSNMDAARHAEIIMEHPDLLRTTLHWHYGGWVNAEAQQQEIIYGSSLTL